MKSHEALKKAMSEKGVKSIAADMKLSPSLLYRWCSSKEDPDDWGAANPLDRLNRLVELTGDTGPIHWLCQAHDGFFVENPRGVETKETPFLQATQEVLSEFSEMLQAMSESYNDDGSIESQEAARIRQEWEELKTLAEQFVVACEDGTYRAPGG